MRYFAIGLKRRGVGECLGEFEVSRLQRGRGCQQQGGQECEAVFHQRVLRITIPFRIDSEPGSVGLKSTSRQPSFTTTLPTEWTYGWPIPGPWKNKGGFSTGCCSMATAKARSAALRVQCSLKCNSTL